MRKREPVYIYVADSKPAGAIAFRYRRLGRIGRFELAVTWFERRRV